MFLNVKKMKLEYINLNTIDKNLKTDKRKSSDEWILDFFKLKKNKLL